MGRMAPGQGKWGTPRLPSASVALDGYEAGAGRHWPQPLDQLKEAA